MSEAETKAPTKPSTGTKKERAQLIYDTMMDNRASRKDIIERFMMDLNMSKAGASTYYYNCKK